MDEQDRTGEDGGELSFFEALGGGAAESIREYDRLLEEHRLPSTLGTCPASAWRGLGRVESWRGYRGGLDLTCANGTANLHWMARDCLRVHVSAATITPGKLSYAVTAEAPELQYLLRETKEVVSLATDHMTCLVELESFRLQVDNAAAHPIYAELEGVRYTAEGSVRLDSALADTESSHGMGERVQSLNLRGGRYGLWNVDQPNCDSGTDPLYYCVPFYVGVHADGVYGVFFDNAYRGVVDIGAEAPDRLTFEFEGGGACYYVIVGDRVLDVVGRYVQLTGKPPLPPLWYFGYHQSRFTYHPQGVVLEVASKLRAMRIPCDVIHLDIDYMDAYKIFTWDTDAYPDFVGMIGKLHQQGFKVIVILDPGTKVEAGYEVYESGLAQDVFLRGPDGEPLPVVIWAGRSHLPDFTRAEVRQWWAGAAKPLLEAGVDGFWNDMNEPAVFSTQGAVTLPELILHGDDTLHLEAHNLYGMLMSWASYTALQQHRPGRRPVNITRAGYAGTQRYASSWTGDVTSSWEHLRLSIPMLLNLGMSGVALTGVDVGGFREDTNAELLTRWTQAACLMPFYRNHSAIDTIRQEPYVFGEPYLSHMREAIELRYRLLPYLYSVAAQASEYGYPMMRPLFTLEPNNIALRDVDDAFLVGEALLVAPIMEAGAVSRDVYLPAGGDWYDFWTQEQFTGGHIVAVDAPLSRLPLFVRAGATLPMWTLRQHVGGGVPAEMTLRVYPGRLETTLYEDAGEGNDHQAGDYRWLYMSVRWANNRLQIQRRPAGSYEPPYEKLRVEVIGFDEEPLEVRVDRQGAPVWYYEDAVIELLLREFELLEITRQIGPEDKTIINRPKL